MDIEAQTTTATDLGVLAELLDGLKMRADGRTVQRRPLGRVERARTSPVREQLHYYLRRPVGGGIVEGSEAIRVFVEHTPRIAADGDHDLGHVGLLHGDKQLLHGALLGVSGSRLGKRLSGRGLMSELQRTLKRN